MSEVDCGTIREMIPDFVGDRLPADDLATIEGHLPECAECQAEFELVQALFSARAFVPDGLAGRVAHAVRRDRAGSQTRPWWGISAAAVAALALGIGVASDTTSSTLVDVPSFAYERDEDDLWLSDDGLLAGAPTLDELSDEALAQLLDELATGSPRGGAI